MKHILVLGGAGFIGINMMHLLKKRKYKILCVDKLTYASNKKALSFYKFKNIRLDINDKKIYEIIKNFKPNFVINFAAETHVDKSIDSPKNFINANIVGVFNVMEVLRKLKSLKIKYIHISTDEVYGNIKKNKFSLEKDKFDPTSPYASSKAASDLLVKSYIKTYNFPAIITNCTNNFGPYQNYEKLIPRAIVSLLKNNKIEIYGDGKNEREWIYVEDHCEAILKIMLKGKIGETYNIGSGLIKNNNSVAKSLIKNIKKIQQKNYKIVYVQDRPAHDQRYALNSSKLRKNLNWKPRHSFEGGIKKTLNWYLNNYNKLKKIDIKRQGLKI